MCVTFGVTLIIILLMSIPRSLDWNWRIMSLVEKLTQAVPTGAGLPCKIGSLLQGTQLSKEEREKLAEVLEVPYGSPSRLPNTAIAAALREEGFDVGDAAVNKHRRGSCRCFGNSPKFSL
jgi:hypothetical protein